MRGKPQAQPEFLTTINLNQRVPTDHPLRGIKTRVDQVLAKVSPLFDDLYADEGRPSIPPEQLLKSRILMALYSVRSERLFCEQLAYNLLWLWFLDRELDEGSFDPTVFTHNYDRVLSADIAKLFFVEVYDLSRAEGWTSDQHFTADGTLIEAWASLKSFVRKDGKDGAKVASAKDDDPGNPTVNFHGEKRRNDTHQSTTDPQSVLYRKANGQASKRRSRCIIPLPRTSRRWHWRRWTNTGSCTQPGSRPSARTRRITKRNLWPDAGSGKSRRTRRAKKRFASPDWMAGQPVAPVIGPANACANG